MAGSILLPKVLLLRRLRADCSADYGPGGPGHADPAGLECRGPAAAAPATQTEGSEQRTSESSKKGAGHGRLFLTGVRESAPGPAGGTDLGPFL